MRKTRIHQRLLETRPPWSRYSPRSSVRRGPRQSPQEDLHTSASLSQDKLLSWGLAGEQGQMGWGTQQFRELWVNTYGEIRWLQDQMSGEDKHEEQLHERSKPVILGKGA